MVLALVENWPRRQVTTTWSRPRPFFQQMANDPERWAVLDASNPQRALWNQMMHHHPIVGGYVTRPPTRVVTALTEDPVRRAFFGPVLPESTVVLRERVDSTIDFNWKRGAAAEGVPIDQFSVTWTGTVQIPRAGEYHFWLASDDGSSLVIDGAEVIADDESHPLVPRMGRVVLTQGAHPMRVSFRDNSGNAEVHLAWQPPGAEAPEIVPASALQTPRGTPGLLGRYGAPVADLGIPASSALARLRADHIRYVIVDGRRKAVATALGIRPALEQYGLAIYEITPGPSSGM
jgi:hypothetical protein